MISYIMMAMTGWGWSGTGPMDPKMASDPSIAMGPMMDSYPVADNNTTMPG